MALHVDLRRMAVLALCAALLLSGIVFMPYAQHVFWAPEAFTARILAPLPLLILWIEGKTIASQRPSQGMSLGLGLLLVWIGWWFLSAGLALRLDLAGRELALWLAPPMILAATWQLAAQTKTRDKILAAILAGGALQAAYALAQSAGLEPGLAQALGPKAFGFDRLNWTVSFGGRAGAFFGNPNFLGGHLAMLLPLALAWALAGPGSRKTAWLRWTVAALLAAGLVATQTRGAWIGAAAGLALLLLLCVAKFPGLLRRHRAPLATLAASSILAAALFVASHAQSLSRISGMFSGDEEIGRRLALMRCSLQMAIRHPLLGVGPGNFRLFFPSVQSAGLSQAQLRDRPYIVSEHAHNDLIQMAADAGFPAALLMLALIGWTYRKLWRGIQSGREGKGEPPSQEDSLLLGGILASLLALHVHGLANFPFLIAPTQMTAWALAAMGLRLCCQENPGAAPSAARWRPWLAGGALAFFCLSAYDAGRMLMKDALWWRAQGEQQLGHFQMAIPWTSKILQLDPMEDQIWALQGQAQASLSLYNPSVESFQEAIRLNEHDHQSRVSLARLLVGLRQFPQAETALAITALEAPNLKEMWEPMGASLYMQGKYDQAVTAYNWASYFSAASAEMLENQAAALGNLNRFQDALVALAAAEQLQPGRAKNYINRAITHYKMGVKNQARLELEEAARRDPKDPQIQQLRNVLH
jgi:O-antigen ligase/Flp pilus assembly protein TadD